jgi:inner membrane protein
MPSVFSHAVFSSALGAAYARGPMPRRFWALAALCSVVPDFDVVAFAFGVPYASMWGHRGITHSLAFALLLGCATAAIVKAERSFASLAAFFTVATASHAALDMLTNGGLGVAAFAPFSAARFFAPWRPVEVSPIGAGFFSARGMGVLASEVVWVWVPAAVLVLSTNLSNFAKRRSP